MARRLPPIADQFYTNPKPLTRHPSESWDLFSFFSSAIEKREIPAFAGMTG
jgi:hypothetical protein